MLNGRLLRSDFGLGEGKIEQFVSADFAREQEVRLQKLAAEVGNARHRHSTYANLLQVTAQFLEFVRNHELLTNIEIAELEAPLMAHLEAVADSDKALRDVVNNLRLADPDEEQPDEQP